MAYTEQEAPGHAGGASGPRAGFWQRFAGAVIDGVLVGVVDGILDVALKDVGYVLSVVFQIAYYTYLVGRPRGQTVGQIAMGIRVISIEDGGPIGYGRAFIRWIGTILSTIVIFLGWLWMLWDEEKQCWHDKLAGDVVVPVAVHPVGR